MGAPTRWQEDRAIDWGLSPKRGVMVLAGLITVATLLTHEAYVVRPADPMWAHLAPLRWWLLPHIAGGALAFLLAPLQFSSTLRRRRPRLHRLLGRFYVGACLVAASLSIVIVIRFEIEANWWAMGTMGALWFLTTLFAWFAALNRNFIQHRLWMGRSVGLIYTFVLTRIIPDAVLPGLDYEKMTALYWAFIVAALLVPDLVLNGRALLPVRPGRRSKRTRAAERSPTMLEPRDGALSASA
ncbi:MAG TPA: DUF2306 domain-containing protein [Allosphingosinicella sp.]|jgi:hypothetical protein|nr:DUF2306 domain-containing protein [Allosphingosinicella sp.]